MFVVDRPVYERHPAVLSFIALGVAAPQGSKSARMLPSGRISMREASKALKPWRNDVQEAIENAIRAAATPEGGWPLLGPLAVDLIFSMPKPKNAPKRRITWPIVKPDLDKLARAVLDAGTYAGAWNDDSQVIDLHPYKVYPGETPGALRQPGVIGWVHPIGAGLQARPDVMAQLDLAIP